MVNSSYRKDVERFFTGQEKHISLFQAVEETINSIGPVTIEVKKSVISIGTKTKFAWIWMPQPWSSTRPEDCLALTFVVDRYIEDEKIVEAVEPYPGRWIHHVIIKMEADLNKDVYQWLSEAYTFSQNRGR
ncbi:MULTISPECIES: DUF5655 domain-containing protein [Neobacillus]|jgi:hypothetical protein|uniref:DUF5655 domain-containing protein n=1 Tax=Neobacillus TaxID=2675232 RepID=UPI000BF4A8C7|nr:DUF5655 domain-containing protein [Neobacillus sp. OS1-33]PEQ93356.1 hypothetical protein CN481_12645 [Bacillus sp. AFS006103]WML24013.1 DUF5655 domain-containing protein [Neobacillus sp. OS1-33]